MCDESYMISTNISRNIVEIQTLQKALHYDKTEIQKKIDALLNANEHLQEILFQLTF